MQTRVTNACHTLVGCSDSSAIDDSAWISMRIARFVYNVGLVTINFILIVNLWKIND